MLKDDTRAHGLGSRLRWVLASNYPAPGLWTDLLALIAALLVGAVIGSLSAVASSVPLADFLFVALPLMAPFAFIIALRLFGGLQRLLIAVMLVDLSLGIDFHLFYQEIPLSALPGFKISLLTISLVTAYIWIILEHLTGRSRLAVRSWLSTSKPLATYTAIVLLSIVVARSWLLAVFEINFAVQALLLYMFLAHAIQRREDLLFILKLLILGVGLQAAIMVALKATGGYLDIGILSAEPDIYGRLSGTVGGPNQSADFLAMGIALALSVLLTPLPFRLKSIGVGTALMAAPALFFTGSRGGWLAFAIAAALIGLVAWRRGWLPVYVPFVTALLAAAILIPTWPYIMDRFLGDDNGSAEARLPLMRMALQIIRDHPLLGVGANNYVLVLPNYLTSDFSLEWIEVVHNRFLLIWSEAGTGALLAFVWFLLDTLYRGWRVIQANDPLFSPLALGLVSIIIGWIVHMQVALFHDNVQVMALSVASGLIVAMYRQTRVA